MAGKLEFRLLGPIDLISDGRSILPGGSRQRDLLALLLLDANRTVSTDRLIDRLWDGMPPSTALSALQVYVAKLRKLLDNNSRIVTGNGGYRLEVAGSAIDAVRFEQLARQGHDALRSGSIRTAAVTLRRALGEWRGDVLADVRHLDGAEVEVTRLEELRGQALGDRIDADLAAGNHSELIAELETLVEEHPLRERHWGQLMMALYREGRQADALRAYRRAGTVLGEELGIEPGPDLGDLEERILLQDPTLLLSVPDPAPATNLERQITSFIGRDQEIVRLTELVRERPLVTLTGPGGAGKTRLAGKIGEDLLSSFAEGVWIVDLAPEVNPDHVPSRVAEALSISEQPGVPTVDTVRQYLEHRELLLIVDNCEHLLAAAAALVNTLLSSCPFLSVLATSRERLGLNGETTWTVPPLAFPARGAVTFSAGDHDAVDLFVARTRLVDPDFVLDDSNSAQVADICRRLDGLPLAIELAAARVNALSLGDISQRLTDRFAVLDRKSKFQPLRHATLRAATLWSYGLLDEPERTLFRRLSVFNGRFTLEDAEEICSDGDLARSSVLDVLARLVDKSLVVAHTMEDQPSRYALLETLRAFATEQQVAVDASEGIGVRHSRRFLLLAETAEAELQGGHQPEWLNRLDADHDNLRSAFDWLMESGRVADALRMGTALRWFWKMRDHVSEGSDRLERALARSEPVAETVRARALMAAGVLQSSSDMSKARALLEESRRLAGEAGDELCQGLALGWLGLLDRIEDRLESSETHLTKALALLEAADEPWAIAFALGHLGVLARERGALDDAAGYHERALQIDRDLGNAQDAAWNLGGMGLVFLYQGDNDRARSLLDEGRKVQRALGFDFETASMVILLGVSAARAGEPEQAAAHLAEATRLANHLGSARLFEATYRARAAAAIEGGKTARAAQLLEDAEQIRAGNGLSRSMFQGLFEHDEDRLATMLSAEKPAIATEAGRPTDAPAEGSP
ncbi:BTAD domain-containing putative transcriptional regulator [Actinomycetota bacterium]